MPRVGFEPTISAGPWPFTYALDRAATETGLQKYRPKYYLEFHTQSPYVCKHKFR